MLKVLPGWRQFLTKKQRRRIDRKRNLVSHRYRLGAFEVLEERAMLSVAQDLVAQLQPYQNALNNALSVMTSLPLVGEELSDLQEWNTVFQDSVSSLASHVDSLTNGHFELAIPLPSLSKTFTFDLGLDAFLQVNTSGGVSAAINPVLNVGFDLTNGVPSLDPTHTGLDIGFVIGLPNFQLTASLNGLLYAKAVDAGTTFSGNLGFNFDTNFGIQSHFAGDAHVRLGLSLSLVDPALNASFNPRFFTDLELDWGFDTQGSQLKVPVIAFRNFSLDADSFMQGFLGDTVKGVQKFTKPMQPFIDMFEQPVPIVSSFDSSETMGDLFLKGAGLSEAQQDSFNTMVKIVKAVNTFDFSGTTGGAVINFGDILLTGDARQSGQFFFDTTQLQGVIDDIMNSPALQEVQEKLETVAKYVGFTADAGFKYPLLENPGPVIGSLLTGQTEVMFSYSTGRQHFELGASFGVGIPDVLGFFLNAGIVFDASLAVGYDTAGLLKFIQDPLKRPEDLLHGFYIDNAIDHTGLPIPNVPDPRKTSLYLQGYADISASAVVTVSGGLYADINFELASNSASTHVYLDDIITSLSNNVKVFNPSGRLYAAANIELTAPNPVGPDITVFKYALSYQELLSFNLPPAPTETLPLTVIDVTNQHTLLLDVTKMTANGKVNMQPFHDFTITSGIGYAGDGIRVDYPNEIVLYVERKNDITTNYYNLIGLSGDVPDGVSIDIVDPFTVFAAEGAPDPQPPQTESGVLLAGGKNVVYKYTENAGGSLANVLLVGGFGSNSVTGGTMIFGNFIPAARLDQAKNHFGNPTGFDAAGQAYINARVDSVLAPVSPSGIIGATMTGSRGGLMYGGPGNNSFFANGPGAYEMIGGGWTNTFTISPSFNGVPATYAIDGGPYGQSKLVVRVPASENVGFENSTVADKYNPTFKALAVTANAGLSATAHGIKSVQIVAQSGSSVTLGDTSELNTEFAISGGAKLTFGGTNLPDVFDVSTSGFYYALANHFPVPYYSILLEAGIQGVGPSTLPRGADPIYAVTRTFGTNGRTQTIPFAVSDASASSIKLNAGGASDTYNITLGIGAYIDVTVDDTDTVHQNSLTVNVRDSVLRNNQVVLTDDELQLDYYTATILYDAIPIGVPVVDELYGFWTSARYTPSVHFGANDDLKFITAIPFLHTTINRPLATQAAQFLVDGQYTTSVIPFPSFGPRPIVFDATTEPITVIDFNTTSINVDIIANAGPLSIVPPAGVRKPMTIDVHGNSGALTLSDSLLWSGLADTLNIFHNSGTIDINYAIVGSTFPYVNGLAHQINVLGNSGTINVNETVNSAITYTGVQTQINVGTTGSVSPGLANMHGALNLSTAYGRAALLVDDRGNSGTPASWSLGQTQSQIGDFTITYGTPDTVFVPLTLQLFETFWRAGTKVTRGESGPGNIRYNGSVNFPVTWLNPGGLSNHETDTVSLSLNHFSVPPGSAVTYAVTNLPTGLSLNTTSGLITGTIPVGASVLAPFKTGFSVTVGDYTVTQHIDWAVQGSISINFSFFPPADFDEGQPVNLSFFPSNSAPRPVTLTVSGFPTWLTYNPATKSLTGTVPIGASAEGPYRVAVRGEDGVSATEVKFDLLVSGTTFQSVPSIRFNYPGDTVDIPIQATTTSGRTLTFSANNLPTGITIDAATGRLTGTITGNVTQISRYSPSVTANDGFTDRTSYFYWNVLPLGIADALSLTSPGPQLSKQGDGVSLTVAARSSLFLSLYYTVQGLPPGFTISNGFLSGVFGPTSATGSPYHVTVTASDGSNTSSTTFDWNIVPANAITVQNPGPLNNFVNVAVNRQIVASTTSGLPLTFSATGLPTGLSISASGLITGTVLPSSAMPSIFNTHVTVTDGTSSYGTMFQWTITNGANQPNINRLAIPGGGTLTLTAATNTQLSTSITTDPGTARPGGIQFPFGYLNFEIIPLASTVLPPGAATTLTISGQSFAQTNKYYKYGPTPADPTPHWYNFLFNVQTDADNATGTGMQLVGGNIVLRLVDGGRGDDDLTKNGVIRDLGGPAFLVPAPQLPGDYNRDSSVNAADYVLWRKMVGTTSVTPYVGADGNGDGKVGQEDHAVWRSNFGQSLPGGGSGAAATSSSVSEASVVQSASGTEALLQEPPPASSLSENDPLLVVVTPSDRKSRSFAIDFNLKSFLPNDRVGTTSRAGLRMAVPTASDATRRDELLAFYQANGASDKGSTVTTAFDLDWHTDTANSGDVDDFDIHVVDDAFEEL